MKIIGSSPPNLDVALAVNGLLESAARLKRCVQSCARRRPQTRHVSTQTGMPPVPTGHQRSFVSGMGECAHSWNTCTALAGRRTELTAVGLPTPKLRPCPVCVG